MLCWDLVEQARHGYIPNEYKNRCISYSIAEARILVLQTIPLTYSYFRIPLEQTPQFLDVEDLETVKIDHFLSSVRTIIQIPTVNNVSHIVT